jgi:uncharacterized protein YgiM (DUF1202 family)
MNKIIIIILTIMALACITSTQSKDSSALFIDDEYKDEWMIKTGNFLIYKVNLCSDNGYIFSKCKQNGKELKCKILSRSYDNMGFNITNHFLKLVEDDKGLILRTKIGCNQAPQIYGRHFSFSQRLLFKNMNVTVRSLRMRKHPSLESTVIRSLKKNEKVKLIMKLEPVEEKKHGNWLLIQDGNGIYGFCASRYLKFEK